MKLALLTLDNPKTQKGLKLGYLTAVLHLAPSDLSGYNVCPLALRRLAGERPDGIKSSCSLSCLNLAGRGGIMKAGETSNSIQRARIRRTKMLFEQRAQFMALLFSDIRRCQRLAARMGLRLSIRLNGTSDLDWTHIRDESGTSTFLAFPEVQFYDYTKVYKRALAFLAGTLPPNYHITLSMHENNREQARDFFHRGGNVAAVVDGVSRLAGHINGDYTDLRFLDAPGSLVMLSPKGPAKRDATGFVVRSLT